MQDHLNKVKFSCCEPVTQIKIICVVITVRSLASYAYRKSLDSNKHFHFDFFTIDFHEEFSALYGGVLKHQTIFTSSCTNIILHLYKSTHHQQKSLLLIGHSMVGFLHI